MKLSLPLFVLAALVGFARGEEVPSDFAPTIEMSHGQAEKAAGVSVPGGVVARPNPGGGGGSSAPDTKAVTPPAPPQKKDDKKKAGDDKKKELPQMPGGGGGGKRDAQPGGQPGGQQGVGADCAKCRKALEASTRNLESKLGMMNPKDKASNANVPKAQQAVTQGREALGKFNEAVKNIGEAHKALEKADEKTDAQNKANQSDIDKLDAAQTKREAVFQSVVTAPPSCVTGASGGLGQGDQAQAEEAKKGVSDARAARSKADENIAQAAPLAGPVSALAGTFTTAGDAAGRSLNAGTLGKLAAGQITAVSDAIDCYAGAAKKLSTQAKETLDKADEARQKSVDTATEIVRTNTASREADAEVFRLCSEIQEKNAPYLAAAATVPPNLAAMTALMNEAVVDKDAIRQEQDEADGDDEAHTSVH